MVPEHEKTKPTIVEGTERRLIWFEQPDVISYKVSLRKQFLGTG